MEKDVEEKLGREKTEREKRSEREEEMETVEASREM